MANCKIFEAATRFDLILRRAGSINGCITHADGRPANDAMVSAALMRDDGSLTITGGLHARTDIRGGYIIRSIPEGHYRISALWSDPERMKSGVGLDYRPTYFPGTDKALESSALRVAAGETARANIVLVSNELLRLTGRVLRSNNDAAIEAFLIAEGWSIRTVSVDAEGAFAVSFLQPGRYTLWARAGGGEGSEAASLTFDLVPEMPELFLPLARTGLITGRVVSADGGALPGGLQIAAVLADQGKAIDPIERDRVDVTRKGHFELRGIFGERTLRVLGLGPEWELDTVMSGKTAVQSLSLAAGEALRDITIVVKRR